MAERDNPRSSQPRSLSQTPEYVDNVLLFTITRHAPNGIVQATSHRFSLSVLPSGSDVPDAVQGEVSFKASRS